MLWNTNKKFSLLYFDIAKCASCKKQTIIVNGTFHDCPCGSKIYTTGIKCFCDRELNLHKLHTGEFVVTCTTCPIKF